MKAIVAVDEKWGIGKDEDLLVHIPGDLKYFKNMTMEKTLIVGRKTLESFPGGARDAIMIVVAGHEAGDVADVVWGVAHGNSQACGPEHLEVVVVVSKCQRVLDPDAFCLAKRA